MLKANIVKALGAMSGTSLDGVDAAIVFTDGERIEAFGEHDYRSYSDIERETIRAALGHWDGAAVEVAAETVENVHAEVLAGFEDIEIVGFHGQTVAHDPKGRGTLQIGNGALLAEVLETPVVWDFRSTDVRFGGEGAPLAPFFHFALAKFIGALEPVAFLNLGGVGNITFVDPRFERPDEEGALLAFDTGPANAPINDLVKLRLDLSCDEGGALAAQGDVNSEIVDRFLEHAFFFRVPPKSLDRDAFASLKEDVVTLTTEDAAATLTACAAMSVVKAMEHCPELPTKVLVTGGGRHNSTLMKMLEAGLDCRVDPVEAVGLNGDMLEAQAFAFLAVRVAKGLTTSCPATTGVAAPVGGGEVSRPVLGGGISTMAMITS